MIVEVLSHGSLRKPTSFVKWWCEQLTQELPQKHRKVVSLTLTVYFVSEKEGRRLNSGYRKKDYVTDVLSFDPVEEGSLGELAISLDQVKRQAKDHHLHVWEELGYVLTHGVLHLLGYDHELNEVDAKKMFRIQDRIFNVLCNRYEGLKSKK